MQGGQEVKHENTRTREPEGKTQFQPFFQDRASESRKTAPNENLNNEKIGGQMEHCFFLTKRQVAFCEGVSLRTVCDKQNKEGKKLVTAEPPKLLASPIYMQSHNHNNYDGFHLKMFQY